MSAMGTENTPIFKNIAEQVMLLPNIMCQMWVSGTGCVNLHAGILQIHAARVRPRGEATGEFMGTRQLEGCISKSQRGREKKRKSPGNKTKVFTCEINCQHKALSESLCSTM